MAANRREADAVWWAIPGNGVEVDKPIVGAAAGVVLGGGFTLAMMTDMLIAAQNATFSYPEAHAAIAGGLIGSLAVRIPHKIAMQVMLVGQAISAQRAYEVGFVNEIVPVGRQVETAMKYARLITQNGPPVVSWFKRLVDQTLPKGPGEVPAIRVPENVLIGPAVPELPQIGGPGKNYQLGVLFRFWFSIRARARL